MLKTVLRQYKILNEKKYYYIYLIYLINTIAAGLLPLLAAFLPRQILDLLQSNTEQSTIISRIGMLSGGMCVCFIATLFCQTIVYRIHLKVRLAEFTDFNTKYMRVEYEKIEDPQFMDFVEKSIEGLGGDTNGFQGVYNYIYLLLPIVVQVVAYIILIANFSGIALIACLVCSIIGVFTNIMINRFHTKNLLEQSRRGRQKKYFENTTYNFKNGKDIRLYQMKDKLNLDFKAKEIEYAEIRNRTFFTKLRYGILRGIGVLIQEAAVYYYIIMLYMNGKLSIGDVSLYVSIVTVLGVAIASFSQYVGELYSSAKISKDYFEFKDLADKKETKGEVIPNDTLEIEFINASFKYPKTDNYIFQNLNLKINKGERLAIVGENGAGKSTIIKLICGLFCLTKGELLINGVNVNEYRRDALFEMFGMVFQEVNVYPATILENICGVNKVDIEKAKHCLELVGLKEKIESLPKKYDTVLSKIIDDSGIELSGGQNQKIAIARALYKGGNMMILDEPTAALDALAEGEIYESFDMLCKGKTAIYISHRLSSTRFCDHIALFSKEGLKEYGTHDELMHLKGSYYTMFEIQGKYYKDGGSHEAEECLA